MAPHSLTCPRLWARFDGWAFRDHIALYISRMEAKHFSTRHIYRMVRLVGEFARWLLDQHGDGSDVHERTTACFIAWRAQHSRYQNGSRVALARLLGTLRDAGVIGPPSPPRAPWDELLQHYCAFLEGQRGFKAKSTASYVWFARPFLRELWASDGNGLAKLTRADIIAYIERHAPLRSACTARIMCCRLRSFLRYLRVERLIDDDLAASVPSIRGWKLTALPSFLSADQLQRVLDHCNRSAVAGRRDYAILLMLGRLGLRANEVATLTLDDIDWGSGLFQICGKGGRRVTMPMPPDVGTALADYLQHGRPKCEYRAVFLRVETPCIPFSSYMPVSLIARRALLRADVTGLAHGHAHVFRHTVATNMIRAGATLTAIGQLLRHQDHDTTRVYAKVDLPSLRLLSQPWPGAVQ